MRIKHQIRIALILSLGLASSTVAVTAGPTFYMGAPANMFPDPNWYNTSLGWGAASSQLKWKTGGKHNTNIGYYSGNNNTSGDYNTALGSLAFRGGIMHELINPGKKPRACCGFHNTAVGSFSLVENITGGHNTAVGSGSLSNNNSGMFNTAIGRKALRANTKGFGNTASGVEALEGNETGASNTANGAYSLHSNKKGYDNTAMGSGALYNNKTGSRNTAIGSGAGRSNTSGSNNLFIGYNAGSSNRYQLKNNKLVIANGSKRGNELIVGDFSTRKVQINGKLHTTGNITNSDRRLKKDIKPLSDALTSILRLKAKSYLWKEDANLRKKKDIGLLAQEVEKVFPELVEEDERGYKGIEYSKLSVVLIEAIKEQQHIISHLEEENSLHNFNVAKKMNALMARVQILEATLNPKNDLLSHQ